MKIEEVIKLIDGKILVGEDEPDCNIEKVVASDLMSDVLAFAEPGSMLVTGLSSPQSVRTANVVGIPVVVIVRKKEVFEETTKAAETVGVTLIVTEKPLFEVCGVLYKAGLKPIVGR